MTEPSFFAAFLIGLAGSVHCIGMCGGFMTALTLTIPQLQSKWPYIISYNIGRIVSYAVAGGISGYAGASLGHTNHNIMMMLKLISAVLLFMMAGYVGGWWRGLTKLEALGQKLWRHIAPLGKTLLPFKSPWQALPYGILWGWLPCGLVYSTLSWSLTAGGAANGALVMAGFGLGTLPTLLTIGGIGHRLQSALQNNSLRIAISLLLAGFSILLLIKVIW